MISYDLLAACLESLCAFGFYVFLLSARRHWSDSSIVEEYCHTAMILGPINGVDCLAFVVFLIPQLLLKADFFVLLLVILRVIPFLGLNTYQ